MRASETNKASMTSPITLESEQRSRNQESSLEAKKLCPFKQLGLPEFPIMLAPLAGVSDYPFRWICERHGADLTYVEMLSAIALCYRSKNTMAMLHRHLAERRVGVQITARNPSEMARGVAVIADHPFDTVDINMGCPVKKVVKTGCGSAALRDPQKVYDLVRAAKDNCPQIVSSKIRLGWSESERYPLEVADAVARAGGAWLTVHGRLRSDRYSAPVDLGGIQDIAQRVDIPVIGNGNIFTGHDIDTMSRHTGVRGVMVSRGALGNPWIFCRGGRGALRPVTPEQWRGVVASHVRALIGFYGDGVLPAKRFRKNLLWYLKGWPTPGEVRAKAQHLSSLNQVLVIADELARGWIKAGYTRRSPSDFADRWVFPHDGEQASGDSAEHGLRKSLEERDASRWDPKYDMDRQWDRGVGEEVPENWHKREKPKDYRGYSSEKDKKRQKANKEKIKK